MSIAGTIARHKRIAFQFSGGRDSTAALYLMQPFWSRMSVYHLEVNDQFPETARVVEQVARDVDIIRIPVDVKAARLEHGMPSDLVPFDNTTVGRVLSGRVIKIVDRMECCSRSVMFPMHQRMLDDGMTLLVRGYRADEFKGEHPFRSGFSDGQVELLHPIEDWDARRVMQYLRTHNLPVADYYAHGAHQAPECMGCTAWWNEGRSDYMRKMHPREYAEFRANTAMIRGEINRQYAMLDDKESDHG